MFPSPVPASTLGEGSFVASSPSPPTTSVTVDDVVNVPVEWCLGHTSCLSPFQGKLLFLGYLGACRIVSAAVGGGGGGGGRRRREGSPVCRIDEANTALFPSFFPFLYFFGTVKFQLIRYEVFLYILDTRI